MGERILGGPRISEDHILGNIQRRVAIGQGRAVIPDRTPSAKHTIPQKTDSRIGAKPGVIARRGH
ncbi:MAG: hypothetical protein M1277_00040 [Patescibacteria group bacterium]|nr:hypothetical protein [Patescibacteria group bacterium]